MAGTGQHIEMATGQCEHYLRWCEHHPGQYEHYPRCYEAQPGQCEHYLRWCEHHPGQYEHYPRCYEAQPGQCEAYFWPPPESTPSPPPEPSPESTPSPRKKPSLRGHVMVTVSLFATLSFQVSTNVPGGLWRDDGILHKKGDPVPNLPGTCWNTTVYRHRAGEPILRHKDPTRYNVFKVSGWIGFAASLLTSFSLLSEDTVGTDHQDDSFVAHLQVRLRVRSKLLDHLRVRWSIKLSYTSTLVSYLLSEPKIPTLVAIVAGVGLVGLTYFRGCFFRRK